MKALDYHKWCIANPDATIEERKAVETFLDKSFSTDMLVNPYKVGETILDVQWLKSESLRLFDGWEIDNEVRCYRCYDGEQYSKYPIVHFNGYEGLTLNDFIVIFTRYNKGKLQWNESNEKVKEVFK